MEEIRKGALYLVATPIGNLSDMTFRAVHVLSGADLIAAEDTRNSRKLLTAYEIKTPMTSYHEFNKYDKADILIGDMIGGKTVALITDAGTPGISDPGEVLVEKCYEAGIPVIPVPGACAAVNALVASGQPTRNFVFEAFLPADKKERREALERLKGEVRTMVLYEAPHRLLKTLGELRDALGDRRLTIAKELTKKHEDFRQTTLNAAIEFFETEEPRGEYVLVIRGKSPEDVQAEKEEAFAGQSVEEAVAEKMAGGLDKKSAIKEVAQERGLPKREVYSAVIGMEG